MSSPRDASVDVVVDGAPDVLPEVGVTCDLGAPPVAESALPPLRSRTVILGGDADAAPPSPSGGDPEGRWLMRTVTFYLPPNAMGQVDAERTTIVGNGWMVVEGNRYRISTTLDLALDTVMVGTVRRALGSRSRGTFTASEGRLALMPECSAAQSGDMPAGTLSLGFSRDAPDRGRLFVTASGMLGTTTLVFDLERAP